ncbi:hypothetical protein VNO80_24285 [Phaseolus coccineus]|uniref:Uncharacterized protein n=1 Tax=Phaseolus coccineus TaxID=3886 RepID=A0AAN9QS74_PHACN
MHFKANQWIHFVVLVREREREEKKALPSPQPTRLRSESCYKKGFVFWVTLRFSGISISELKSGFLGDF